MAVQNGAMIQCSFGTTPGTFTTTHPEGGVISDIAPISNIGTFGLCNSPANPEVSTATAAALGVLTPMPCVPSVAAPWTPAADASQIEGQPAIDAGSICNCAWAGVIAILG
jgi:Domain of unknown function (DUF4280)